MAVDPDRVRNLNEFARDRHPGMVGVEILRAEPEEVTGRLDVRADLVAGTGFLWAPVIVTLADWLVAVGTPLHCDEDASFTTVEFKTNFIGTVREGGAIFGRATPVHVGRSTQVWDVVVSNEANDKAIAVFRGTQMILPGRRQRS